MIVYTCGSRDQHDYVTRVEVRSSITLPKAARTDVTKVHPKFATGDENLLLVHLREGQHKLLEPDLNRQACRSESS